MVRKTTNWQVRLDPELSNLVRKKARQDDRSINKIITVILELYFGLKKEETNTILIVEKTEKNT